ncbi:MAG: hypothetical protein IPM64_03740 [Phycisphaerales bacterium]|nr:hypothetical protein [Phycisphaerales bacterium]
MLPLLIICLAQPATHNDVVDLLDSRRADAAGLVYEYSQSVHVLDEAPALDADAIEKALSDAKRQVVYQHRLTTLGNEALNELLTDDPAAGYEPVVESMLTDRYVSRHVRVNKRGLRNHAVVESGAPAGTFRWNPAPAAFNVRLSDVRTAVSASSLILDGTLAPAGKADGLFRFAGTHTDAGITHHLVVDVAADGLIERIRQEFSPTADAKSLVTREHVVRSSAVVNGLRVPVEAVVVVSNSAIPAPRCNIHVIEVTQATHRPGLSRDDVTIRPETVSAMIRTERADGTSLHQTFNEEGRLAEQHVTAGPEPLDGSRVRVARESQQWRRSIPVVGGVAAALTALGMCMIRGRGAVR